MTVTIRALRASDLDEADRVMRLAFGTFIGLPDPTSFMGDASFVRPRFGTDPAAAFALDVDGRLVGSNFAIRWGSVGVFGPLSLHPEVWSRHLAPRLMEPVLDCFARWQIRHAGLFTFPQSPKHLGLYQKFGFRPRFLTAIMSRPVPAPATGATVATYAGLVATERPRCLADCRALTDTIYPGLDVGREIESIHAQRLGDTVLLREGDRIAGLAACHHGPGTEAGSGTCYVKFAGVRPGAEALQRFDRLLDACEALAAAHGAARLTAGVNTACHEAYERLRARGYRTDISGVAMHRPNEAGYHRPAAFVLDDWR